MSAEIIKEIFEYVPGMISEEEGIFLFNLASKCRKGVIVEIGSDTGRSTVCLAKGSKYGRDIPVYSVDPHNGGGSTPDPTWFDSNHDGTPNRKYYINQCTNLSQFQQTLRDMCVDDIVAPLADYSELIYKQGWTKPIELLFIDGDHRYNYVKIDVEYWGRHLISGGMIILHDSTFPGVRRIINEFIFTNPSRFTDIKESPIFNAKVR